MNKNQILFLVGCFILFTTNLIGQLTWTPEKIVGGEEITISFDPKDTPLENEKVIIVNLYQVNYNSFFVEEIPLTYDQDNFTGKFKIAPLTKAIFFGVTNEKADYMYNRGKKPYKTICYQSDRKTPVEKAYASASLIVCEYAEYAGAKLESKEAYKLLAKEFETHPVSTKNIKLQNFHLGLAIINKDKDAIVQHNKLAQSILKKKNPSETELFYALKYTERVKKDMKQVELIKDRINNINPRNSWNYSKLSKKFKNEKDISAKIVILKEWDELAGADRSRNSTRNFLLGKIAQQYAEQEDWDNYRKYLNMIDDTKRRASSLNRLAWFMSGETIEGTAKNSKLGLQLSKESLQLLDDEMTDMTHRPKVFTQRQYKYRTKFNYAMYADTYALLAYKNGDLEEALKYQLISCENNNFSDAEMNERYSIYFEQINDSKATEAMIANLIIKGKTTAKLKEKHKELFLKNNTKESAYDQYIIQYLEEAAIKNRKEQLKEKMINSPAPKFELVNLQGEKVKSEDLKGKVVVVDFWATWCKPCIASFPGMQQAVNKFQKSDDVEFVFIDTWESGDDITKKVSKFISSKNYAFNVLLDFDGSVVGSFGVTGIPTKFVIDKKGMIRFRSSGVGGNEQEIVNELTMMIELAGGNVPTLIGKAP